MSFAGMDPSDPGPNSGFDYSDIGAGQRSGAAQLPFGDSLGQTARDAFMGASRGVYDYFRIDQERQRANLDRQFNVDPSQDPGGALIDPKEWQAKYPDLGLTFTPDMGQAQAQLLVDHRKDELYRQYVLDHSPNTLMAKSARGLTEFAASALDPLNVAAAFVPGLGETRAGLIAARYGKTIGRIAEGASAGATGMAALTPLQAIEADAYQDHYGPMDAFLNVAFGTVLGGGLHAGLGAFSDLLARAAPETRIAALRASVAQAVEGRPVDVEPVLATDPHIAEPLKIGTADKAGPLEQFPVINHDDLALASQEARHQQDIAGLDQNLTDLKAKVDALPAENPEAVQKVRDLKKIQEQMAAEDLTPEGRRTLGVQRDQILTDTNPETLTAQAQPTFDRASAETQRRGLQGQRDSSAAMLARVRAQRDQAAVLNALGPYARSSIDRARQNSIDFARGAEPSTVAAHPEAVARAEAMVKAGDDPKAELADAEQRIADYKDKGIISDEEHAAFDDANKAGDEAAKTRTLAAVRAAACLAQ